MKYPVYTAEEPSVTSPEEAIPMLENTLLPGLDATRVSSHRAMAIDRGH